MSDFIEARDEVIAAMRAYGDQLPVSRETPQYDALTRKRTAGVILSQTLWGRVDSPKNGDRRFPTSETKLFERSVILSPENMTFEPAIGDILIAEGRKWRIEGGVNITRGGGIVVVVEAGLVGA